VDDLNFCALGGWLVGARHPVPTAPFDFVWAGGLPTRGCNHLVCHACGQRVRHHAGFTATLESRQHLDELWQSDDWGPLVARDVVREHRARRFYVCRCDMHVEDYDRAIDDPADWPDDDPGRAWRCGGHPRVVLPATVDGVALAADTDVDALVSDVLLGRRPSAPPEFTRAHAAAWLVRLYHVLEDGPLRRRLAAAVAAALTAAEPRLRAGAADFYRNLPHAPGGERVVAVLRDHPDLVFGVPNPFEPTDSLDGWLQTVLAARLDDPDAAAVAQGIALGPHEPNIALIGALIASDRDFVLSHLEAIIRPTPSRALVRNLLYFLGPVAPQQLVDPLIELGRSGLVDLDDLLDVVRQLVWSPYRDAVWAAFGRTLVE
jgi:hypothetical protein